MLDRWIEDLAALDLQVSALVIERLAREQTRVDVQKLVGDHVTLVVGEEDAVALVFRRIAAGDDVDEQASPGKTVQRRRHARRDRRRLQAGPHRHQEAQPLGQRHERRGDDPGILTRTPGRQKHAEIAAVVRRLRDLREIFQRDVARAEGRAQVAAIAMRRQEPQDVGFLASMGNGRNIGLGHAASPSFV